MDDILNNFDFSVSWEDLTLDQKVDFASQMEYDSNVEAEFWWNYYKFKYNG